LHVDVFSLASTSDGGSSSVGLTRHRSANLPKAVHLQCVQGGDKKDNVPLQHRRASDGGLLQPM
jgi:hypothetical protein